ncbi:MAG: DUF4407 domain-containing protein [Coprobacter sp.]|nr:DUF4407 domain-containing protein [Coprobacter sp.]
MKIGIWDKVGCFLIGWDKEILKECTPASRKMLTKYTSALIILMILWFFIGFMFPTKYMKTDIVISLVCGFVCSIIILMVERQIILMQKKNVFVAIFRFLLGLVMSLIGALVVDNMIFGNDIKNAVNELSIDKVQTIRDKILQESNVRLAEYRHEKDSLSDLTDKLYLEYQRKPQITKKEWIHTYQNVQRGDTVVRERVSTSKDVSVDNPIKYRLDAINSYIVELDKKIDNESMEREKKIEAQVAFYEANPGILMELNALMRILKESIVAVVVYFAFFVFFLMIELLVIISKFNESKCDYDVLVQRRNEKRIQDLCDIMSDKLESI